MSAEVLIDRTAFSDDPTALSALQTAIDAGGTVVVTGVFSLAEGQSLVVGQQDQDVTIKAGQGAVFLVGGTNTIRQIRPVQMTLVGLNTLPHARRMFTCRRPPGRASVAAA